VDSILNICFTADHELFTGQNIATEEEIVIRPTYKLMEVLEEFNIPLCLMTDVWSILRYRELGIDSPYAAMMEEQLRYAILRGHDVQLHVHSHWLNSEYVDGQWKFDYDRFRLHSFGFGTNSNQDGQRIIALGKQYLVNLLKPMVESYECVAFRAGGWCLQPEEEFLRALAEEGLRIDTSVFFGGYNPKENQYLDFRHVPSKPNWWIAPKTGLEYEATKAESHLFEVAIGSYGFRPLIGIRRALFKLSRKRRKVEKSISLGLSMDRISSKLGISFINRLRNFFFQPIMFTYDSACKEVMLFLLSYYLKRFDCQNQELYICIIGHPKALTEGSLAEIREFCEIVNVKYRHTVRFIRLSDIPL